MADFKVIPVWEESVNRNPQAFNAGLAGEKVSDLANLVDGFNTGRKINADYNEQVRRTNALYDPAKLREEQYQRELENQRTKFDLEFDQNNKQEITNVDLNYKRALTEGTRANTAGQLLQNEYYPETITSQNAARDVLTQERAAGLPFAGYKAEQEALKAGYDAVSASPEGQALSAQIKAQYSPKAYGKGGKLPPLQAPALYGTPGYVSPKQKLEQAAKVGAKEQENIQYLQEYTAVRERVAGIRAIQALNAPYQSLSREDTTQEGAINRLSTNSRYTEHPDPVVREHAAVTTAQQLQEWGSRAKIEEDISQLDPDKQRVAKERLDEAVVAAGAVDHYSELQKNLASYGLPDQYLKKPEKTLEAVNNLIDKGSIGADENIKKALADSDFIVGARTVSKVGGSPNGAKQPYTINTELIPGQPVIDPITGQPGAPGPSQKKVVFRGQDGTEYLADVLDPKDPAYNARWIVEAAAQRHNDSLSQQASIEQIQGTTDAIAQAEAEKQQLQAAAPLQPTQQAPDAPTVESVPTDPAELFKKQVEDIKNYSKDPQFAGADKTQIEEIQRSNYEEALRMIEDPALREQLRMENPLKPDEKYSPVVKMEIREQPLNITDPAQIGHVQSALEKVKNRYFEKGQFDKIEDKRLSALRRVMSKVESNDKLAELLGPNHKSARLANWVGTLAGISDEEKSALLSDVAQIEAMSAADFAILVGGTKMSDTERELLNAIKMSAGADSTLEQWRQFYALAESAADKKRLLRNAYTIGANSENGTSIPSSRVMEAVAGKLEQTPTHILDSVTGKVVRNPEAPQTVEEILFPQSKKKDDTQAIAPSTVVPPEETPPPTTGGNTPPGSDTPSVEPVSDDYRAKVDEIKAGLKARVSKDGNFIERGMKNMPENMAQMGIGIARKVAEGVTNVVPALMSLGVDKTTEEVKEGIKTSIASYLEENYPNMKKLYDWELETVANSAIGRHIQAIKENNDEYLAENPMTNIAAEIAAFLVPSTAVTKGVNAVSKVSSVAKGIDKANKAVEAVGTAGKLIKGAATLGAGVTSDVAITKVMHPETDNTTTALISGAARTIIPAAQALKGWYKGDSGSRIAQALKERVDPEILKEFVETQKTAVSAKDARSFLQNIDIQKYPQFKGIKGFIQEQLGTEYGLKTVEKEFSAMQKAFQSASDEVVANSKGVGEAMQKAATTSEQTFTAAAQKEAAEHLDDSIATIAKYAEKGKTSQLNKSIDDVSTVIGKKITDYSTSAARSVGSDEIVKRIAGLARQAKKAVGVDKIPFIKKSSEEITKLQKKLYTTFEKSYPTVPEGTADDIIEFLRNNQVSENDIMLAQQQAASRESFKIAQKTGKTPIQVDKDTSGYLLELVDVIGRETGKNNIPARQAMFNMASKILAKANGKRAREIVTFFDNYGAGGELAESLAKQGTELQKIVDVVAANKPVSSRVTGEAAEGARKVFGEQATESLTNNLQNLDQDINSLNAAKLEGTGIGKVPVKPLTVADAGFDKALDPRQLKGFKEVLDTKVDANAAASLAKLDEESFQDAYKNIISGTGRDSKLIENLNNSAFKNLNDKMQAGLDYAAKNTDRVVRAKSVEEFLNGIPGQKMGATEYKNLLEMAGPGSKEYLEAMFNMVKNNSREMEQFFTKGVTDLPSLLGNNATIGFRRGIETPWYGTDIGLKAAGAFRQKLNNKTMVDALTSKDPKVVEKAFTDAYKYLKGEVPGVTQELATQVSVFVRGFLIGQSDSNRKARAARNRELSKNKKK